MLELHYQKDVTVVQVEHLFLGALKMELLFRNSTNNAGG
jgi:hypothetical protein